MDFAVGFGNSNSHLNLILLTAWMYLILPLFGMSTTAVKLGQREVEDGRSAR